MTEELALPKGEPRERPAQHASWTEADEAWLQKIEPAMHKVARMYGRTCFSLVMNSGLMSVGFQRIAVLCERGALHQRLVREIKEAVKRNAEIASMFVQQLLTLNDLTTKDFAECKTEVERIGELLHAAKSGQAPGSSIILPTRH